VQVTTRRFDEVFVEEYPKLVALGASMSGDREIARELAQETMLRAHQRWDEVAGYDVPGAWLRRVMSNLLIDHHRSVTSERRAIERLAAAAPVEGIETSPDDWGHLMAALTPQQRLMATLYYADDLSVEEIADTVGISIGGVKSTLSKVRRRLRRHRSEGSDT
jgi:RNA polymerase sigma-70 factor (ECF subfamily)